ncbi:uncharacterized protein J3R85_005090 [Psidium guajava]|nr:uncharacterized protein J3R85_005090 [Psidium guajava]
MLTFRHRLHGTEYGCCPERQRFRKCSEFLRSGRMSTLQQSK